MARVLVVDDNPDIRFTVASVLDDEGIAIDEATTGTEALARVRAERPAVILLDYFLPEMDGAQFCAALEASIGRAGTRIVVFTAGGPAALERIRAVCRPDAVVSKPFDLDVLLTTVLEQLAAAGT